jgi:hypothetical protein
MNIDPLIVSTPIGAAIGVVMTKKLLAKKDQSFQNLAIGGGIGGGAGFLAGQYIKGEPGDIEKPKGYMNFMTKQMPTGVPSSQEQGAVDSMAKGGIYRDTPSEGGWGYNPFKRTSMEGVAQEHGSANAYKMRVIGLRRAANVPGISDTNKQALLRAADSNERSYKTMAGRRTRGQYLGVGTSIKALLKGLFGG